MKKQNILIAVIVIALLIISGAVYLSLKESPTTRPMTDIILFYGEECPHCKDVEKFLEDNKIAEKVRFDSVEVWHNKDNAKLMLEKADECGIAKEEVGVPFAYSSGRCFIGAPDVEALFRQKAGI